MKNSFGVNFSDFIFLFHCSEKICDSKFSFNGRQKKKIIIKKNVENVNKFNIPIRPTTGD